MSCNLFLHGDLAFCAKKTCYLCLQTHETRPEEHHALSLELGHILVEMQEPEQAITYFTPSLQKVNKETKFKLLAAAGQLRYHQWYLAWGETLSDLRQQDDEHSPSRVLNTSVMQTYDLSLYGWYKSLFSLHLQTLMLILTLSEFL